MPNLLVLYHSQQHGNTDRMARAVAEGAQEAGADVSLVNTNESRLEAAAYRAADAVAFGSPDYYSYIAGGMKMFLDDWFIWKNQDPTDLEDKPYGLFYSHGGGGAVLEPMEELFSRMGTQVGETIESCGAPGARVLEECKDLGRKLAEQAG
jgi:NAD(P)H dehydrogenase (quinone)